MSSLVDRTELVGFFSYSREDDDDSEGALSRLRDRIQRELSSQLGRSREDFRLWQDKAAIPHGALWENEITSAIAQSVFLAPLTLPNVARNVIAQLLGYAIGLSPNADPTTLMCGRPARCPPALFASDRPKYFPLTEAEKVDLRRMYPPSWQASRS
jgi:hypothetical protein